MKVDVIDKTARALYNMHFKGKLGTASWEELKKLMESRNGWRKFYTQYMRQARRLQRLGLLSEKAGETVSLKDWYKLWNMAVNMKCVMEGGRTKKIRQDAANSYSARLVRMEKKIRQRAQKP